ncbi:hypothetical protein IMY05_013G0094500 [Salix suchowensis]|nr:hypothetical protein IMY05_013G0094500 [Salix suchowensis]
MAAKNKPGSLPIPVGLLAKDLVKGVDVIKDRDWYNDRSVAVGTMKPDATVLSLLAPKNVKSFVHLQWHISRSRNYLLYIDSSKVPVFALSFSYLNWSTLSWGQGSMNSFHGLQIPRCCNENLTNSRNGAINFLLWSSTCKS